jgi:hypothetical protein
MARKTFKRGQPVEIQREPGYSVKWENATYLGAHEIDLPAHHLVRLHPDEPARYIDSMTGAEVERDHPRAFKSTSISVPSRRIRIPKAVRT